MKSFLLPLLLLFLPLQSALATTPLRIMASTDEAKPILFSSGLKVLELKDSGKEMVFDYMPGKSPQVWLFIHGLGDDMSKMEKLAVQAANEGYGILRVDLLGHGATLRQYLHAHPEGIPQRLYYMDNIHLIYSLLLKLQIRDLVVVGHSYGGGITYGLAEYLQEKKAKIRIRSIHMLAPYVQRIDKFLKAYMQSPAMIVNESANVMEKSGAPPVAVHNVVDPLLNIIGSMTSGYKYFNDYMNKTFKIEQMQDFAMDQFTEDFMKKSYRKYFIEASKKTVAQMTAEEMKIIDLKVQAAILVTKGIRDFDLLDTTVALKLKGVPVQVIGGKEDKLVLPAQLMEFEKRLEVAGIPHKLEFVSGENSHHLFPRLMPTETFALIKNFVVSPK